MFQLLAHSVIKLSTKMILFAVLFLDFVASQDSSNCTWKFENSCYHYVKKQEGFWAAETYCDRVYNGHLLSINNRKENDFIMSRLSENRGLHLASKYKFVTTRVVIHNVEISGYLYHSDFT